MANRTINQHFVPRFYLKNFATSDDPSQKRIWVLNLKDGTVFKSSIENVGSENMFFDDPKVEPQLTRLENIVVPWYQAIVDRFNNGSVDPLNSMEIASLAIFISTQWWRTKQFRRQLEHNVSNHKSIIIDDLRNKEGLDDAAIERLVPGILGETSIQSLQADMLLNPGAIDMVANKLIANFHWEVMVADAGLTFITSDNPVAMRVGHLGDVENEIVFPLTRKLLLVLRYAEGKNKSRTGRAEPIHAAESNANQLRSAHQFVYGSDEALLRALNP
jgi:hypothetical protein